VTQIKHHKKLKYLIIKNMIKIQIKVLELKLYFLLYDLF